MHMQDLLYIVSSWKMGLSSQIPRMPQENYSQISGPPNYQSTTSSKSAWESGCASSKATSQSFPIIRAYFYLGASCPKPLWNKWQQDRPVSYFDFYIKPSYQVVGQPEQSDQSQRARGTFDSGYPRFWDKFLFETYRSSNLEHNNEEGWKRCQLASFSPTTWQHLLQFLPRSKNRQSFWTQTSFGHQGTQSPEFNISRSGEEERSANSEKIAPSQGIHLH